jgi:tRNA(Ile)-lysidine synthase
MLHPAGFGMLDAIALGASDPELAERALARMAASVGGASYPLRRMRVAGLRAGLSTAPERARTLGGCRFVPWRERILVLRELAAAEPPIRLEPRESLLWDGRFRLSSAPTADRAFTVGYLGQLGAAALRRGEAAIASDLPRLVHPVLPAFWDNDGLAAVPALGYRRALELVVPQLRFRPANPLANAGFTVV